MLLVCLKMGSTIFPGFPKFPAPAALAASPASAALVRHAAARVRVEAPEAPRELAADKAVFHGETKQTDWPRWDRSRDCSYMIYEVVKTWHFIIKFGDWFQQTREYERYIINQKQEHRYEVILWIMEMNPNINSQLSPFPVVNINKFDPQIWSQNSTPSRCPTPSALRGPFSSAVKPNGSSRHLLGRPSVRDIFCITSFIELDDGKIYRKNLYLMVKTMVSYKFSLQPIQWIMVNPWDSWDMVIQ